jgi:hypothetical protein
MSFLKKNFSGPGRSLGEAPAKPAAPPPRVQKDPHAAEVKFEIRLDGKVERKDGKFTISQPLADLYTYLEQEIFQTVEGLEIFQPYPRALIPRDTEKALASMQIKGTVLLQVTCKSGKYKA